nr:PREDICTED: cationic amino acid transporter 4-like isoform X2 [Equus przewalskii]
MSGCRPGVTVAWALRVLVVSAIILHCVLAFGNSALHLPPWGHSLLLLLSSLMFLLSLLVLGAHQQKHRQGTFQVPMVPLTPALSILLNVFLMLHLSYLNWLRSSVWLLIGHATSTVDASDSLFLPVRTTQEAAGSGSFTPRLSAALTSAFSGP